ncbi:polar amino acid transport system permease protein [Modicisalibacter muralis]|uniref:Polar amino acid transport system permease protein n=1 Tax=Modicisalibacter muralis TaxID=119000 RepID=A0A1G9HVE6_9GAMM|nr:amino acid ABC transporter permease/ATP-binding protein [Halomonas muralis]SDL16674.1 polar amino acid transport system permease protein [Halomonas muralis]
MSFDWEYALSLLWYAPLWEASLVVVALSVLSWLIATFLSFFLALAKLSSYPLLKLPVSAYVWFFRSLPLLVLLIFIYNLPQVIPWTGNYLSDPFTAGLVALILSETAYIAEIHRGGLLSVPPGQREAGQALGISYFGIQKLIVIPQSIRIALPTLANQFITIVKLTSLVSVISLAEILLVGQRLYTQNFKVLETMLAVAFFYVFIVTFFDNLLKWGERNLDVTHRKSRKNYTDKTQLEKSVSSKPDYQESASHEADEGQSGVVIEATGINKSFSELQVLKDVSISVKKGEAVSIIGPSGSGKTTLIRTLNGLAVPDTGIIKLDGENIFFSHPDQPRSRRLPRQNEIKKIGMVFQQFNLFPHKNVLQNITLGPRYHRRGSKAQLETEAMGFLDKVGMLEHAYKYPHQLSGGQQQRVAIARALAMHPKVMLFDEPTSALDPELVGEVLKTIEVLAREGMTLIIVTHEMQFARRISDKIYFMDEGSVVHSGSPQDMFDNCDEPRVRQFLKEFNGS